MVVYLAVWMLETVTSLTDLTLSPWDLQCPYCPIWRYVTIVVGVGQIHGFGEEQY